MSVQGVMNTRLQERVGLWEANAYVQGTAFALSLVVMWLFGTGNLGALSAAPKGYLLGGALGLVITVTVMLAIKGLDVTVAVSAILISQLLVAALIDAFGSIDRMMRASREEIAAVAGIGDSLAAAIRQYFEEQL